VTYDADKPNKSVLVIDDSSSMLSSIKALLSEKYKVVIVPGGKQGVRYLSKKKPDIILLDYLMPEMDGVQTLEEIRKLPDCSDIPVLFLTGADDKSINDLSELNVQGVVKKPPVLEDLLKSIEEALR
jgi:putative two-component system response regulator